MRQVSGVSPESSNNKTDRHYLAETLLTLRPITIRIHSENKDCMKIM